MATTTRRLLMLFAVVMTLEGCTFLAQVAERDRTVTVSIEGALVGPATASGKGWDGKAVPPLAADIFADAAVEYVGVGEMPILGDMARVVARQLAARLADRINDYFAPPDTWGTVKVLSGRESSSFELTKNSNSYTPLWSLRIPSVAVHKSTITVTLKDSDLLSSQKMARITLDEQRLLDAEAAGGTVALDTRDETGGAVYRLFILVERSP